MMDTIERVAANETALMAFAAELAKHCRPGTVIFLVGELGAGKTTMVRGALRGLGFQGVVRSPTYTLVEAYDLSENSLCHFDLYRLGDPDELEYIGIRDYLNGDSVCWIEWPERGAGLLPEPDIEIVLDDLFDGRIVKCQAKSTLGCEILGELQ